MTLTMHATWIRMALSGSSTSMCTVPTDQKISPDIGDNIERNICGVTINGIISCGNYWSYKNSHGSPSASDGIAFQIRLDGNIYFDHISNSYGIALRTSMLSMCIMCIRMAASNLAVLAFPTEIAGILHLSGILILPTQAKSITTKPISGGFALRALVATSSVTIMRF